MHACKDNSNKEPFKTTIAVGSISEKDSKKQSLLMIQTSTT